MTDTTKPRKELRRMSDKRLAQLGGKAFSTLQPNRDAQSKHKPSRASSRSSGTRTGMMRRKSVKPRNAKRREREFARCYGSKERVAFVKALPCSACHGRDISDNHHIRGDGAGRKADYLAIIPLCRLCHAKWHRFGRYELEEEFGFDADAAARTTESAWQAARSQGGDSR